MAAPFQEVRLFHSEVGGSVQLSLRVIQLKSKPIALSVPAVKGLSLRVFQLRSKPSKARNVRTEFHVRSLYLIESIASAIG